MKVSPNLQAITGTGGFVRLNHTRGGVPYVKIEFDLMRKNETDPTRINHHCWTDMTGDYPLGYLILGEYEIKDLKGFDATGNIITDQPDGMTFRVRPATVRIQPPPPQPPGPLPPPSVPVPIHPNAAPPAPAVPAVMPTPAPIAPPAPQPAPAPAPAPAPSPAPQAIAPPAAPTPPTPAAVVPTTPPASTPPPPTSSSSARGVFRILIAMIIIAIIYLVWSWQQGGNGKNRSIAPIPSHPAANESNADIPAEPSAPKAPAPKQKQSVKQAPAEKYTPPALMKGQDLEFRITPDLLGSSESVELDSASPIPPGRRMRIYVPNGLWVKPLVRQSKTPWVKVVSSNGEVFPWGGADGKTPSDFVDIVNGLNEPLDVKLVIHR